MMPYSIQMRLPWLHSYYSESSPVLFEVTKLTQQLTDMSWCLGLHSHEKIADAPKLMAAFDEAVNAAAEDYCFELRHVDFEGDGFSGKSVKINSKQHKKAIEQGFSGISGMGFNATPPKSDAPAFDSFFSVSFSVDYMQGTILSLCVNNGIVEFQTTDFYNILSRMTNLCDWTTGYALLDKTSNDPELHVLCGDSGKLSPDEYQRLNKWYISTPEKRDTVIRDIYPVNLLNDTQLSQELNGVGTIRDFANQDSNSIVTNGSFGKLTLWAIPIEKVREYRMRFQDSAGIICS